MFASLESNQQAVLNDSIYISVIIVIFILVSIVSSAVLLSKLKIGKSKILRIISRLSEADCEAQVTRYEYTRYQLNMVIKKIQSFLVFDFLRIYLRSVEEIKNDIKNGRKYLQTGTLIDTKSNKFTKQFKMQSKQNNSMAYKIGTQHSSHKESILFVFCVFFLIALFYVVFLVYLQQSLVHPYFYAISLVYNSFNDYYDTVVYTQILIYAGIYPWLFNSPDYKSL